LRHPEQVQFRYRMLGYNEDWVPAGSRREAFFTKVPPGEYTFEVAAATGNEEWTSVRLPIAVEAHVYQTIWFKFAVALTIALLLFALHLFRVRSIERYAQQLHSEIENRKKAEHDRERMELSLMRSMRLESVGRLAGGIAHDFNNVLTAILGHADQARTEAGTSNPDLNEQIAGVIECGERAASLTSQLLAFSRQQVLHPQTISPNRVIEGLRPMLTQLLPDNVLLTWRPEKALPDTRVDPGQLEQVVMNLVLNARDAMPDGGEIVIETRSVDHAGHHNTGPATGQHIEISVTDDGNGMEADVASRVFDPFFTTKNAGQGTGLGLASVHGIVLQSGGHIEVDSQPSLGTVFRVYFPALHTHSAATDIDPGSGPAEPLQLTGTGHILLCEDNDSIRPLLRRTLADNGYTVLETSHPDDALALVQNGQHVELLITDVILPGMNGRELATAIRQQLPDTRVIFISGYTDEILDQSSDDGAAFLQKPFRPSELLRLVHDILNRSEGRLNADQDEVEPHFSQ
ncbi:MAG: response regulator, partial [Gammaproteobacteria bacterium]|nr:response regulator [Gammaproteobacteria bacterium]